MNSWKIVFYRTARGKEPVSEFIRDLGKRDQGKIIWTVDLLKEHGTSLPAPYLKRLTRINKLWELRTKQYRIFLSFLPKKNIILIHAIKKKTAKTPKKDLQLAEQRLKEIEKNY